MNLTPDVTAHIRRHPRHGSWQIETPEGVWEFFFAGFHGEEEAIREARRRFPRITSVQVLPIAFDDEEVSDAS